MISTNNIHTSLFVPSDCTWNEQGVLGQAKPASIVLGSAVVEPLGKVDGQDNKDQLYLHYEHS